MIRVKFPRKIIISVDEDYIVISNGEILTQPENEIKEKRIYIC